MYHNGCPLNLFFEKNASPSEMVRVPRELKFARLVSHSLRQLMGCQRIINAESFYRENAEVITM